MNINNRNYLMNERKSIEIHKGGAGKLGLGPNPRASTL